MSDDVENCENFRFSCNFVLVYLLISGVYLPPVSSAESCDIFYPINKEEMEVANTVQPYKGEQHASSEDFDQDRQRRFLACSVQVKIRVKISRY